MRRLERLFEESPIQVKDLRKFFSQEWDRRGGPTSIKKILMGHSLKGDVDLMHYNAQSEKDLKKIYDKVMNEDVIV
jgi:integrase/recombinase XerD